jgi:hypothetical protein
MDEENAKNEFSYDMTLSTVYYSECFTCTIVIQGHSFFFGLKRSSKELSRAKRDKKFIVRKLNI